METNESRGEARKERRWKLGPAGAGNSLRFDLVAGSVTAAVVIPKAMAYATIAGVPTAGPRRLRASHML